MLRNNSSWLWREFNVISSRLQLNNAEGWGTIGLTHSPLRSLCLGGFFWLPNHKGLFLSYCSVDAPIQVKGQAEKASARSPHTMAHSDPSPCLFLEMKCSWNTVAHLLLTVLPMAAFSYDSRDERP